MCGVVDYNQPCTRTYTGTPEGKLREIGRFKYLENGGELKSLTFDGGAVNLDGISFDVLLAGIAKCEGLVPIQVATLPEPGKHSGIEDVVAPTPVESDMIVHRDVARGNDVHAVNCPVTVEASAPAEQPADDWCTPENVSDWQEPDELEKVKQAEARKKLEGEPETVSAEPPKVEPPPVIREELVTRDAFENAIRETAMNAAAREALYLCNIECGSECYVAANIIRANATVPHFLDTYSKCLEHVGIPHSIEEIAAALPNQEKWLHSLSINNWKIKD